MFSHYKMKNDSNNKKNPIKWRSKWYSSFRNDIFILWRIIKTISIFISFFILILFLFCILYFWFFFTLIFILIFILFFILIFIFILILMFFILIFILVFIFCGRNLDWLMILLAKSCEIGLSVIAWHKCRWACSSFRCASEVQWCELVRQTAGWMRWKRNSQPLCSTTTRTTTNTQSIVVVGPRGRGRSQKFTCREAAAWMV